MPSECWAKRVIARSPRDALFQWECKASIMACSGAGAAPRWFSGGGGLLLVWSLPVCVVTAWNLDFWKSGCLRTGCPSKLWSHLFYASAEVIQFLYLQFSPLCNRDIHFKVSLYKLRSPCKLRVHVVGMKWQTTNYWDYLFIYQKLIFSTDSCTIF